MSLFAALNDRLANMFLMLERAALRSREFRQPRN
jgi:hypothetical protein